MLQQKIDRITDILRRDDGISGAMHYTEQISWVLFLKFLDSYEEEKVEEAFLEGKEYDYVIDEPHRWNKWACIYLMENTALADRVIGLLRNASIWRSKKGIYLV